MGKKHMSMRTEDGFIRLIRSEQHATRTNHKGNVSSEDDDSGSAAVEYWKLRCKEAERQANKLAKKLKDYEQLIDYYQDQSSDPETISTIDDPVEEVGPYVPQFQGGIGLSITPGEDPKLYRISDPDGDLIPKKKFAGADLQLQPGRGFKIGLRWK